MCRWLFATSFLSLMLGCVGPFAAVDFTSLTPNDPMLRNQHKALSFLPVAGKVEHLFGYYYDDEHHQQRFHRGIDILCALETQVKATAAGKVVFAGLHPQYGLMVELQHNANKRSRYGHLARTPVIPGEMVALGEMIGLSGQDAGKQKPHLHYEILDRGIQIDPVLYTQSGQIRFGD
jgi:murein DD-endopeptidase MepM/ murein hydrolase activator NlpD